MEEEESALNVASLGILLGSVPVKWLEGAGMVAGMVVGMIGMVEVVGVVGVVMVLTGMEIDLVDATEMVVVVEVLGVTGIIVIALVHMSAVEQEMLVKRTASCVEELMVVGVC